MAEVRSTPAVRVCAYCKKLGAWKKKCGACRQRRYCGKECQRKDWKKEHRNQCKKLQQVFVPPAPQCGEGDCAAAASGGDSGGGVGDAAAASGGGACDAAAASGGGGGGGAAAAACAESDASDGPEHPCPICFEHEDDAIVDSAYPGMCFFCGQLYCGWCVRKGMLIDRSPNCPTCRAPFFIPIEKRLSQTLKLLGSRSPGRHTPIAHCNIALLYQLGEGVVQNNAEALKYYKLAADQGNAQAQCNIGAIYNHSVVGDLKGVQRDSAKALHYFKLASKQGHAGAQCNLGSMYASGDGVPQDNAKAMEAFKLAAANGRADAQASLGKLYYYREGVPTLKDHAKARKYFTLAADQGNDDGQLFFQIMHGRGEGLPGDHSVFTAAKPKPNEKLPNGKYRHIGSLSWSELCVLQWNGDDFNRSHSQRWVYVPFIPGHDSDSDLEYEPIPLQTINGHVTSPVYVGGGGVPVIY